MNKKSILYIMHVDWDWIKQRPHFLAETLTSNNNLIIAYAYARKRSSLTTNKRLACKYIRYLNLPLRKNSKVVKILNDLLLRIYFSIIIFIYRPELIWITYPTIINYIPSEYKGNIVYDCMDDAPAIEPNLDYANAIITSEKIALNKASVVFASSNDLIGKLNTRYGYENARLIRNAYNGKSLDTCAVRDVICREKIDSDAIAYKIGYIGTISDWFDLNTIMYSLEHIDGVEYHLIGPVDFDVSSHVHPQIKYYNAINHDDLINYVSDFDCMIMPFKVSALVESVDPVKLYEYVDFNKPIISVYYPEIERFHPFVEFYSDKHELVSLLAIMKKSDYRIKYDNDLRVEFLRENSWASRGADIQQCLDRIHG